MARIVARTDLHGRDAQLRGPFCGSALGCTSTRAWWRLLKLSVRASNCLESENITTVRDLVRRSEDQLLDVRNFGDTTLHEVREKLAELGLRLGMRVSTPTSA